MWWVLTPVWTLLLSPQHKVMNIYRLQWAMYGSILRKSYFTSFYKITFFLCFLRVQYNWHFTVCVQSQERWIMLLTFQKQDSMEANSEYHGVSFLPKPFFLSLMVHYLMAYYNNTFFFTKTLKRIYYSSTWYHVFISLLKLCFLSAKLRVIAVECWLGFSLFDYC